MEVEMKRYLLFVGVYESSMGGWDNLHQDYDSLEEAMLDPIIVKKFSRRERWWHVVDLEKREIVKEG
jgi:hypothetical protein